MVMKKCTKREIERERKGKSGAVRREGGWRGRECILVGSASGWEGEGGEWNDVKGEHHLL